MKTYKQGFADGYKAGVESKNSNIELLTKNRKRILKSISHTSKTMTQIQKELDLNYRTIWFHIQVLDKAELITQTKNEKLAGKPVFISLKNKNII